MEITYGLEEVINHSTSASVFQPTIFVDSTHSLQEAVGWLKVSNNTDRGHCEDNLQTVEHAKQRRSAQAQPDMAVRNTY